MPPKVSILLGAFLCRKSKYSLSFNEQVVFGLENSRQSLSAVASFFSLPMYCFFSFPPESLYG